MWHYLRKACNASFIYNSAVLRIPIILNSDPDPDSGSALEKNGSGSRSFLYWFAEFSNFLFYFFSHIFYPKTWWTIQKWGNFIISLFSKVQILVLGVKQFFFAIFGWDFTPWIRIRIQKAKILRIQRIRILSTERNSKHVFSPQ